jgi:hypothetical protein
MNPEPISRTGVTPECLNRMSRLVSLPTLRIADFVASLRANFSSLPFLSLSVYIHERFSDAATSGSLDVR